MFSCQIVAHRGGNPENTLSAFRQAQSLGVDAIEFDVHLTRDGHPMVFHDTTLDRLTTGTGNWLNLGHDDLAQVRIRGTQEHIPDLDEVLSQIPCRIFLEIKSPDPPIPSYPRIAEIVLEKLRQFSRLDSVVVISFDWNILKQIKSLEPQVQTGMLVEREQITGSISLPTCHHLLEQARDLGCTWIDVDYKLLLIEDLTSIIAAVKADSRYLGVWTVNDSAEMKRLIEAGIDAITTDYPNIAQQVRDSIRGS